MIVWDVVESFSASLILPILFLSYIHNKTPIDLPISHFLISIQVSPRWRLEKRQRRLLLRLKHASLIDGLIGKRKRLYWILCRIQDEKDGHPFRWTRDGNNALIEMSLMKNEKSEIGLSDTKLFFSTRTSGEWKFSWNANYLHLIYITCLKYAFLLMYSCLFCFWKLISCAQRTGIQKVYERDEEE